jgi:hypothetical protein
MTTVRVENREELSWPPWKCACCGEKVETAILVVSRKFEEHITREWKKLVPSCELCKKHQEIASGGGDSYAVGCLVVFLAVAFILGSASVGPLLIVVAEVVCVAGYYTRSCTWDTKDPRWLGFSNEKSASIRQPHWHRLLDVKRPTRAAEELHQVAATRTERRLYAQVDFRREMRPIAFVDPGGVSHYQ